MVYREYELNGAHCMYVYRGLISRATLWPDLCIHWLWMLQIVGFVHSRHLPAVGTDKTFGQTLALILLFHSDP